MITMAKPPANGAAREAFAKRQAINLYNPELLPRADRLDLGHGLAYMALALIAGLITLAVINRAVTREEALAAGARESLHLREEEVTRLSSRPHPTVDPQLVAAIAAAQSERGRLDMALEVGGLTPPPPQFSRVLGGLARWMPSDVWLTALAVDGAGVTLEGWALHAEPVAQLASDLGRDAAFGGQRFARFELERQPPLGTPPPGPDEPPRPAPPGDYRFLLTSQERTP